MANDAMRVAFGAGFLPVSMSTGTIGTGCSKDAFGCSVAGTFAGGTFAGGTFGVVASGGVGGTSA